MSLAFVFPGQGSQSVGMLADLATAYPVVEQTFAEASEILGYDLWKLTQEGPEEELNKTHITQPALLAAGIAVWRVWQEKGTRYSVRHSTINRRICEATMGFRLTEQVISHCERR